MPGLGRQGHALHSMFARTKFQTVAGTRSALDFVELPSHLLEFFVRDYRVVSQFARHPITGDPIPRDVFETAKNNEELFIGVRTATFDTILGHFSRVFQLPPAPHAPCATLYFVTMLIGCWLALGPHPML